MAEKDRVIEKIQKCLALSRSSNPHEAEAALRQARKLMDKYQLEMSDIEAMRAAEFRIELGNSRRRPVRWVIGLAFLVGEAFGCAVLIRSGNGQGANFIGVGESAKMAGYAYDVMALQLETARKAYVGTLNERLPAGTKSKMGRIFAESWIRAVYTLIEKFAGADEEAANAIEAYQKKHYPNLKDLKARRRKHKLSQGEYEAVVAGEKAAEGARLHVPVGGGGNQALLEKA